MYSNSVTRSASIPLVHSSTTSSSTSSTSTSSITGSGGIEIIKDRLYFVVLRFEPSHLGAHFFTVDNNYVYEPFFSDFGPLHLGHIHSFCNLLDSKLAETDLLKDVRLLRKKLYMYTSYDACKRTNAAMLLGAYSVIRLGKSPEEAVALFETAQPFLPYRDASVGISTFNITILDCLCGLYKAMAYKFYDHQLFNLQEYLFFERVENGDLNWIVPNKLLAFSGPVSLAFQDRTAVPTVSPEEYSILFKRLGVSAVVRLNKREYDKVHFSRSGIKHYDLYFMDGSAPSEAIVKRFLEIAESEPGAVAVHCKAGLGRTGTLIASYLIKNYRFTAAEAIAYIRICRPGSIIGPQQHFLQDIQSRLWKTGEKRKSLQRQSTETAPEINVTSTRIRAIEPTTNPSTPEKSERSTRTSTAVSSLRAAATRSSITASKLQSSSSSFANRRTVKANYSDLPSDALGATSTYAAKSSIPAKRATFALGTTSSVAKRSTFLANHTSSGVTTQKRAVVTGSVLYSNTKVTQITKSSKGDNKLT